MNAMPFSKIIEVSTEKTIKPPRHLGLVIEKIGANADIDVYIAGKEVLNLDSDVVALYASKSNYLGPLTLGKVWWLAVPPSVEMTFKGTGKVLIEGKMVSEKDKEAIAKIQKRYEQQPYYQRNIFVDTLTISGGSTWSADAEKQILSLTGDSAKQYILDGYLMLKNPDPTGLSSEDIGIILHHSIHGELDDDLNGLHKGINAQRCPLPPNENNYARFLLEPPIYVGDGETLKVYLRNESGGDYSPTSNQTFKLAIIGVLKRKREER